MTAINVPEDFEGIAAQRAAVTNVLVAEALAYGDMGLALPILAPARCRVGAHPLGQRRSAGDLSDGVRRRERTAGVRRDRRAAPAVRPDRAEDHGGAHAQRLPARRREVVGACCRGRRIVRSWPPNSTASRRCSSSSRRRRASPSRPDPSMGIRAAALGQIELDHVTVPLSARLGEDERRRERRLLGGDRAVAPRLGRTGGRHRARGARLRGALRQGARGVR